MHSFQCRGRDGSPTLLPHHTVWIGVVDVWARYPLAVSGVLCIFCGERAEAPCMPHTIPGVDFEQLL
jgi:hypothetical protein